MSIEFRCPNCKQRLRVPDESRGKNARCVKCQSLMQVPAASRIGLPWERSRGNRLLAFLQTMQLVSFRPSKAFAMMRQTGGMGGPMLYSWLGLFLGMAAAAGWESLMMRVTSTTTLHSPEFTAALKANVLLALVAMVLVGPPLMATIGNLINGGILHVCLLLCGGSKHPFATSLRISCFVQSSLMWLCLIPGGSLAIGVWSLAASIIAVRHAHEVPIGRAVLAVVLPMIVLMAVTMLVVIICCAALIAVIPAVS